MGKKQAVVFLDDVVTGDQGQIGPAIDMMICFPTGSICRLSTQEEHLFRVRVWERGAGITLACGSGACAVGVAIAGRGLGGQKRNHDGWRPDHNRLAG